MTLLDSFKRVRDIGGSRSRFPELGFAKHVCGPILTNDDILRTGKDRGLFENCGVKGEDCPLRRKITAAILSHVDYHMTADQMTRCITGPTFIINHDFNRFDKGVGAYNDYGPNEHEHECKFCKQLYVHEHKHKEGERHRQFAFQCPNEKCDMYHKGVNPTKSRLVVGDPKYEANVTVFGNTVSMKPDGGTPYMNHPFHNWGAEGSVVSKCGAFTYVRLGDCGETSVYYCHPDDGVYDITDGNALTTRDYGALPIIQGHIVEQDSILKVFRFRHPSREVSKTIDAGLVSEVSLAMASCIRDDKYADTMRSYLTGKMRAKSVDLEMLDLVYELVSYLSDIKAITVVPFTTCIVGHPVSFSRLDCVKYKIVIACSILVKC
jgi:hypothetical protein